MRSHERFIPGQHDGRLGHGAKREQKLPACVFHCLAIHDVVMMEMCFAEALCFHISVNIAVGRGRHAPLRHVPLDYAGAGQTRMHHGHARSGHAGTNAYDAGFGPLVQSQERGRRMHVEVRHGHGCEAGQAGVP